MNLKKFMGYAAGVTLGAVIVACNGGGSPRSNPNTNYGQLVSGGTAESNPALAAYLSALPFGSKSANPVSMASLNVIFSTVAINAFLDPAPNQQVALKKQNESYINDNPAIFGIEAPVKVETPFGPGGYVNHQASLANVSAAKYDYITYTTPGAPFMFTGNSASTEVVSGLVVLPLDSNNNPLPESQIKGVVLYYHPTVLSKAGIPSGYGNKHESSAISLDDQSTFYTQFELSSIYASDGYIVIAPDYIGQGIDAAVVHPYVLLSEPNALSGMYMLKALDTYLQESYGIKLAKTKNKSLFISSYSEGAGYALKATNLIGGSYANIIENTGLSLKGTVGVSGAYDLTNQELPFGFDNVNNPPNAYNTKLNPWNASPGCEPDNSICQDLMVADPTYTYKYRAWAQYEIATAKPPLGAYMVNTLVVYDYTPAAYNLVFVPPYASQSTCLNPASLISSFSNTNCTAANLLASGMDASYNIMNLFNTKGIHQLNIADQVFNAAVANKYFVGDYTNTMDLFKALGEGVATNSASSFIQPSLLTDPGISALVRNADTYNLTTNTPVTLLSIKYDSVVTNLNWMSACGYLGANGNIHDNSPGLVTCKQVDNSQLFANVSLFSTPSQSQPIYMNHPTIEAVMQIAAHNQMK